ncbi:MAG TPA: DUF1501 domain-containing protein [Pirellulaceae bacterium]|nr:DUF1501 domain-containing protein [Pirellulaceae bacterium]HMO91330.1 DUF1501 domain-containing protein [Pirellulaceae bacterium]HMP70148.1 DUF1501 domain-containing protein [Pirellulaceae bacterium]
MLSRRDLLQRFSVGFGGLTLSGLLHEQTLADDLPVGAALKATHHLPRAKRVIFCYMSGGVSHLDSFDPKPELKKWHGQPMPMKVARTQFNDNGNVMASPFKFSPAGESQIPISSLFPNIAKVADELAVIRSMTTPFNEHAQGNLFMHTGFPIMGHPSAGAWCAYGLGSTNRDLPAYVVLQSGGAVPPHGGVTLFTNGFLLGHTQGSILQADRTDALPNLKPASDRLVQRRQMELAKAFDAKLSRALGEDNHIEAAIANFETAFRMQTAVPDLCDISGETSATRELYGIDHANPTLAAYARQCLLARRLVEQGVRFVELSCLSVGIGAGNAPNPWDQHGELERGHKAMAEQVDQPIAALLTDLKQRGLLDDTLVIWTGEFGRTPFSQGSNGRDHNPFGFSMWLAGGGVRGGTIYGATDEFGYHAVEGISTIYDLWATVLHLLGIDHEKLTYRYGGRDIRLTDVHGRVIKEIF